MALETDRMILDAWDPNDWTAFRPIATDVEVMRYITGGVPWTDEQIIGFVERQVKLYSERGFCRWKLIEKASAEVIGFCGVGYWRDVPDPEIGWWLARRCWGHGLATEAGRVALQDALERVGLDHVISVGMVENAASRRVMEKLGLTLESYFENDGAQLVRYGIARHPA